MMIDLELTMMKTKPLCPDANHAPTITMRWCQETSKLMQHYNLQKDYTNHDGVEHRFSGELKSSLYPPEAEDSYSLCSNSDE